MNDMQIISSRGPYLVKFHLAVKDAAAEVDRSKPYHCIVDSRVMGLHAAGLAPLLEGAASVVTMEATEDAKSLENLELVHRLAQNGVKRTHLLVAVGGGIIQDMTCFVASILFRGMDWALLPTTLLAQADSCIGSKSSINAAGTKNLVGTFYPPKFVGIATEFLDTLDARDVKSGVGEMLKVHVIDGPQGFDRIAEAYDAIFQDRATMLRFVHASLAIKQRLIEIDEFDQGPRNVMNYGHSFGHAIEAVTNFAIPHGIAVSLGADMANYIANRLGRMSERHFHRMHPVLRKNYDGYERTEISVNALVSALGRDKKNSGANLALILPNERCQVERVDVPPSETFRSYCEEFLSEQRVRP